MKNIFKKIVAVSLILMLTVLLSGCGDGDDEKAVGETAYDGGEYTLNVDPGWRVIQPSDFYAEIPQETLVAFTTPEAYDGFFINVNVIREDLGQEVSSLDYARANINLSGQRLTDYEKIQEGKIDISGQPSLLHIFLARLNSAEKRIRFIQLYATKGRYGYIVTGGMLPDTPQEIRDQVGASVTSFGFK
jgi:hypothetical protein